MTYTTLKIDKELEKKPLPELAISQANMLSHSVITLDIFQRQVEKDDILNTQVNNFSSPWTKLILIPSQDCINIQHHHVSKIK